MDFETFITKTMQGIGYNRSHVHKDADLTEWFNFTDGNEDFNVCYVLKPIESETIKSLFGNNDHKPILFVVNSILINNVTELWFRALHAIYYGRVYLWDGDGIVAWHYDWANKQSSYSKYLDLDGILFTYTDCKLRDFPGVFHIARFYDRAFWKEPQGAPKPPPKQHKRRKVSEEDLNEEIKRKFREYMHEHSYDWQSEYQQKYDAQPNRYNQPTGDKWLQGFMSTGNLATARAMYKALAKEWHLDLNPGKPQALETMQAINIAFDKVKDILR